MASNLTEHFSLNQWLPNDQVVHTDFNEDNAKIDAVLGGLAARTGMVTLQEFTVQESSNHVEIIPPNEINWKEWRTIHVDIIPAAGTSKNLYLCYSRSFVDHIASCSTTWNHIVFMPFGQPDMSISALVFTDSGSFFRAPAAKFTELVLGVMGELGSYHLKAGTKILVRGERL